MLFCPYEIPSFCFMAFEKNLQDLPAYLHWDFRRITQALNGAAQWVGHCPANQKVTGSIPGQGTCLGCGPGPS